MQSTYFHAFQCLNDVDRLIRVYCFGGRKEWGVQQPSEYCTTFQLFSFYQKANWDIHWWFKHFNSKQVKIFRFAHISATKIEHADYEKIKNNLEYFLFVFGFVQAFCSSNRLVYVEK